MWRPSSTNPIFFLSLIARTFGPIEYAFNPAFNVGDSIVYPPEFVVVLPLPVSPLKLIQKITAAFPLMNMTCIQEEFY